jgi:hypothetical protein
MVRRVNVMYMTFLLVRSPQITFSKYTFTRRSIGPDGMRIVNIR